MSKWYNICPDTSNAWHLTSCQNRRPLWQQDLLTILWLQVSFMIRYISASRLMCRTHDSTLQRLCSCCSGCDKKRQALEVFRLAECSDVICFGPVLRPHRPSLQLCQHLSLSACYWADRSSRAVHDHNQQTLQPHSPAV